jgi:hypothetical protein
MKTWEEPVLTLSREMVQCMETGKWFEALSLLDKIQLMLATYKDAC